MPNKGRGTLVRSSDAPERATLLELLFDVAYVAALALSSVRLAGNLTPVGALQLLVLLMAIWWTWSITALLTDFYNPERLPIQAMIAGKMLGTILLAAAVPHAFTEIGVVFAGAYVVMHVGRGIVLMAVLRGHTAQIRATRFLFWFVISGFFWIGGIFADDGVRLGLWAVAITIDYVAAGFRYPTPRIGRVPVAQYNKASKHLGERYQQFVILALGDLLLVPTLRLGNNEFTVGRVGAFTLALVTTLLLWQIYVFRADAFLQSALRGAARATRWAPYTHLLMVLGVVCSAAGFDLVIARPEGTTPGGWIYVIFGGPMLFLIGRTIFEYVVFHTLSRSRLVWVAVLPLVGLTTVNLPPVLVTAVSSATLLGVVVSDALHTWRKTSGRAAGS
ncbi:low temperature requirement protein LtrA [Micromonospora pisi]|uniref:Low temperature requirement protein LtrA n=1 Tax=Micromonospora pisi TaxID=589240 RepID=A0A495JMN6_9ACTN|nr:low temperature requirement protein A [Micromonospora pisi]RKR90310.1 low temperature requirement protein LtrA [Micromonospora pisi]